MRRLISFAAALIFISSAANAQAPKRADLTGPASPIYMFTDEEGNKVTPRSWVGGPAILAAAYTTCPTTCSFTIKNLKTLQSMLPKEAASTPIYVITIDPAHDTPEVLKAYKAKEQVDWHFLTAGDAQATRAFLANFNVSFGEKAAGDNHIMHPNTIILLDKKGKPVENASGITPDFTKIVKYLSKPVKKK